MKKKDLYDLCSRILSLRLFPDRAAELSERFPAGEEDWQQWVQMGSNHLVLPAMYLLLKEHLLLSSLPEDLVKTLEGIHALNLERNRQILRQCAEVKEVLQTKGIETIFLKGSGNLLDGLYGDPGERMLYDIDILVEDKHMLAAAHLFLEAGCQTRKAFNPMAYSSTMHYPILLREDWVAGVEIHRLPVQYHYLKAFAPERIFERKKPSSVSEGFLVMDDPEKVIHNFMHAQLMHNGHVHADVSLRDLYDLLLLSRRMDLHEVFRSFGSYRSKSSAYLHLLHRVFDLTKEEGKENRRSHSFFMARHRLTLAMSPRWLRAWHVLILAVSKYLVLPVRTLFDRNARNYVFSRLGNPHWYGEHLRAWHRRGSLNE